MVFIVTRSTWILHILYSGFGKSVMFTTIWTDKLENVSIFHTRSSEHYYLLERRKKLTPISFIFILNEFVAFPGSYHNDYDRWIYHVFPTVPKYTYPYSVARVYVYGKIQYSWIINIAIKCATHSSCLWSLAETVTCRAKNIVRNMYDIMSF